MGIELQATELETQVLQQIQLIEEELREWQLLEHRLSRLLDHKAALLRQYELFLQQARAATVTARQEVLTMADSFREGLASMRTSLEQLTTVPEMVRQAAAAAQSTIEHSVGSVAEAGDDAMRVLRDETSQLADTLCASFEEDVAAVEQFLQTEFSDTLEETYQTGVDAAREAYDGLRSATTESIEQMAHRSIERVHEFSEQMDALGDDWKESVGGLKDSYEEVIGSVTELGKDVTKLMDVVDLAMKTTGTGMNLATKSLDDIRSVMEDIV